jgi:hypothetical protein
LAAAGYPSPEHHSRGWAGSMELRDKSDKLSTVSHVTAMFRYMFNYV